MSFSGRFLLSMIHFAAERGAPMPELIGLSGHSDAELCDEEFRVEAEVYNRVLEAAVEQTGDAFFGLHAGEYLNLSAMGLIAQITQTSSTIKQALDYCCEFSMLGCRSVPLELKPAGEDWRLAFVPDPAWALQSPVAVKQTIDGMMAFTLREYHTLTHRKSYPLAVALKAPRSAGAAEYERVFQCPIRFEQEESAMHFGKDQVAAPVATSDFNLLRVLVEHAQDKLAQIQQDQGIYHLVKRSVVNLVKPEFPTIEQVAGNLNLSIRTLQRKLGEEGHTFKQIIDELRQQFAMGYLRKPELSINEIAFLLNYADGSAFIRSFKRWTGKSPNEYRSQWR